MKKDVSTQTIDTTRSRLPITKIEEMEEETKEEMENRKETEDEREHTNIINDAWSVLERLPRELIFQIIDYAPESVRSLKLASRILSFRINEYTKQARIPLVEEISFTETGWNSVNEVSVHVPRRLCPLFEMSLKIRLADETGHVMYAKRACFSVHPVVYKLKYSMTVDRILPLEKWLGKQLGKVTLFNCAGSILDSLIDQLTDFEFSNLELSMSSMSKRDFDALLTFIKAHNIVQLSLRIGRVENFNHERALIDLSSNVRILYLGKRSDDAPNHLFGIHPTEWARIGTEMFSRRLDTLCLHNFNNPLYISAQSLVTLLKELPRIGKKVLFQATGISQNATDEESLYTQKDGEHVIKFISDHGHWSVGVKHSSTLHECYALTMHLAVVTLVVAAVVYRMKLVDNVFGDPYGDETEDECPSNFLHRFVGGSGVCYLAPTAIGTMAGMRIGRVYGGAMASPITLGLAMGGRMIGQNLYDAYASDCEKEQQKKNPYEHGKMIPVFPLVAAALACLLFPEEVETAFLVGFFGTWWMMLSR